MSDFINGSEGVDEVIIYSGLLLMLFRRFYNPLLPLRTGCFL
jgi:hypothetical protein